MNLKQALKFSELSDHTFDGCTLALNFGVTKYCDMHDRLLAQLVDFTHPVNKSQIDYLTSININHLGYFPTRLDADRLFRDGLAEKVDSKNGLAKAGYWFVKWSYYSAVRFLSLVFKR